jgi:hypothetical protein
VNSGESARPRRPCPANERRHLGHALDLLHDAKGFGVDELLDELPALDRAVLVEHHHGHVLHVHVEREPEGHDLDERRKEHEEERGRVAEDDREFLEENGFEPAHITGGKEKHQIPNPNPEKSQTPNSNPSSARRRVFED